MTNEQEDDALFDRLAKSLEAVRHDAELARSGGAAGISVSIGRVEVELRQLASRLDSIGERLGRQERSTTAAEAGTTEHAAALQSLRQSVETLSARLQQQEAGLVALHERAAASRTSPAAAVGIIVALLLAVGTIGWLAFGEPPLVAELGHRLKTRASELIGIQPPPQADRVARLGSATPAAPAVPAEAPPPQSPAPPDSAATTASPAAPAPPASDNATATASSAAPVPPAPLSAAPLSAAPLPATPAPAEGQRSPSAGDNATAAASAPVATTPPLQGSQPDAAAAPAPAQEAVITPPATPSPAAAPPAPDRAPGAETTIAALPLPPTPGSAVTGPPTTSAPGSQAAAAPAIAPPSTAAAAPQVALRATADSWVEVRQKGGRVLIRRTMKAGETWPVPADPDLLLTVGNPAGLEVVVNGVASRLPGAKGVVRDLPLDADLIKSVSARGSQ